MNGTLTVEDGASLYDFLDLFGRNLGPAGPARLQEPPAPCAPPEARLPRAQRPLALGAQRRPPLRPVGRDVRALPGQRAPVHLRLPPHRHRGPGDRAAAQGAAHRGQAPARARHARARHRLRLGQPRPVSGPPSRRRRHRGDPVQGAGGVGQCPPGRARPRRPRPAPAPRLSRGRGQLRPGGLDRHARACRRAPVRDAVPQDQAAPARRRRGAGALDRPGAGPRLDQRLDQEVHLPGRLHPGSVAGAALDRAQRACGSPTSRSCACTTPTPCASGASGSPPTGTEPPPSTTSASAACGSTTSPPARSRSAISTT